MYYTPQTIISKLTTDFKNRPFLDLCSSSEANERIKAAQFFTDYTKANCTSVDAQVEAVFANPPYERGFLDNFVPFFFNLVEELDVPYVLLVNSSTSSKWYQLCHLKADRAVICAKRIGFYDSELQKEVSKNRYDQTIFVGGGLDFTALSTLGASVKLC